MGPFALTLEIMPCLARAGTANCPARVVNVSSRLERNGSVAFLGTEAHSDNDGTEEEAAREKGGQVASTYNAFQAYATSKVGGMLAP